MDDFDAKPLAQSRDPPIVNSTTKDRLSTTSVTISPTTTTHRIATHHDACKPDSHALSSPRNI